MKVTNAFTQNAHKKHAKNHYESVLARTKVHPSGGLSAHAQRACLRARAHTHTQTRLSVFARGRGQLSQAESHERTQLQWLSRAVQLTCADPGLCMLCQPAALILELPPPHRSSSCPRKLSNRNTGTESLVSSNLCHSR